MKSPRAHPFMPNSVPQLQRDMLQELGIESVDELFGQIPAQHRLDRPLRLPAPISAETELRRHMLERLRKNVSCEQALSFLGGGIWQHHVPAVCDEIVNRS
ncbi:MAG: aminomethyl-transferring glycine dehydrogenase, partial [Gammaproteobacteria bacterium]|nr:aminomethyl-transferring glycine dehydrogenase [Gammaproteobacteria bacterium]